MKFENPIMNISMFEVENVVTASGDPKPQDAIAAANDYLKEAKATVEFTF